MAFEIVLSKKAEQDFDDILQYILFKFGDNSAVHFKNLTFDFIGILENFPEIGTIELIEKNIRSVVIHKRLKIFYRIKNEQVIILRLFDTRQNPDKV